MSDPYLIGGPAMISFSGGRTSGYMLWNILQAHGGALPDDVRVVFANTGKEREETLRFVHECGTRWGVLIHWVEWRDNEAGFEEVGYNSASRNGEPFAALIAKKKYTPNAVTRFCTSELKIRPMKKFMQARLSVAHWVNVIGLRYDEGHRVLKALARNDANKEPFKVAMPMSRAHHTKRDVMRFWLGDNADPVRLTSALPQGFDLGLRHYEGNCDLCFLKGRKALEATMRERPGSADWWVKMEEVGRGRFVTEYSYASLDQSAQSQPLLFDVDADEHDVECGLTCEP